MPLLIPILIPALAKTSAEVSAWLILEYFSVGSVSTIGVLYGLNWFKPSFSFEPLKLEETPLDEMSQSIEKSLLYTHEHISRLSQMLESVKDATQNMKSDEKVIDEVCENIHIQVLAIEKSMVSIQTCFQALQAALKYDDNQFSQMIDKIQSLEKLLEDVKSQSMNKIQELTIFNQELKNELDLKDQTLQRFFKVNQALVEQIKSNRLG